MADLDRRSCIENGIVAACIIFDNVRRWTAASVNGRESESIVLNCVRSRECEMRALVVKSAPYQTDSKFV